jgi:hypothetical protein
VLSKRARNRIRWHGAAPAITAVVEVRIPPRARKRAGQGLLPPSLGRFVLARGRAEDCAPVLETPWHHSESAPV